MVAGAKLLGYQFHVSAIISCYCHDSKKKTPIAQIRKPRSVFVTVQGASHMFEIPNVCEFKSLVNACRPSFCYPTGKSSFTSREPIVIPERVSKNQPSTKRTLVDLEVSISAHSSCPYLLSCLIQTVTLCIASRKIPEAEYQQCWKIFDQPAATIGGRGAMKPLSLSKGHISTGSDCYRGYAPRRRARCKQSTCCKWLG